MDKIDELLLIKNSFIPAFTELTEIPKIKNHLAEYKGDMPVYLYHEQTKEYEFTGKENLVSINDALMTDLALILGKDNIVIQN